MSYSLVFKKDGVQILSFGVSHPLAVAFTDKPWDNWETMPRSAFADARNVLTRQDEDFVDDMDIYNKMLEYSQTWENRHDAAHELNELKKERRAIADAKVMLDMLEWIWEEGAYSEDQSNMGLEWGVF